MNKHASRVLATLLVAGLGIGAAHAQTAPATTLDKYTVQSGMTVSGISSGAGMALQYAVAWADEVAGVGAVAGPPYGCAEGTMTYAVANCMKGFSLPDANHLYQLMTRQENRKNIAPLAAQTKQKVWWFTSTSDEVVANASAKVTKDLYRQVYENSGIADWQSRFNANVRPNGAAGETLSAAEILAREKAVHAQPTPDTADACDHTGQPYLVNCRKDDVSFDASEQMFTHFYGTLKSKAANAGGTLKSFEQKPYVDAVKHANALLPLSSEGLQYSFAKTGYLFVPDQCEGKACRLHVALHGCTMTGDTYAKQGGYNAWAAANDIVVLYPRVIKTTAPLGRIVNPEGCWDWWGYTGDDYATRNGAQLQVLRTMVQSFKSAK
ncbi:MAG: hypothetical protein H7Y60_04755 [Rhodospirillaceae bacterium]|nr:hypothetical protein [Rhodospirillales bacterium]